MVLRYVLVAKAEKYHEKMQHFSQKANSYIFNSASKSITAQQNNKKKLLKDKQWKKNEVNLVNVKG